MPDRIHGLRHVAAPLIFTANIGTMGRAEQLANCNHRMATPRAQASRWRANLGDRQADACDREGNEECRVPRSPVGI